MLRCAPLLPSADHFFTARNVTLRDRPDEWAAVAAHIGVPADDLLLVRQVHEADVSIVTRDRPRPWPIPQADAVVSTDPDAAIGVRVADCVPILLAARSGRAVGAVHAGWRGVAANAAQAAVNALRDRFGIEPAHLIAAVGPSIGPCCYEVGESTRDVFAGRRLSEETLRRWFSPRPAGKFHLDLWAATREQLLAAGIPSQQIHVAALCTRTHADTFHSYRVDGAGAGRMVAVIRARG